jgi:hypothetical protein
VKTAVCKLVLWIAGATLGLLGPALSLHAESPTFTDERANVWILDQNGETVGTFNLRGGAWTTRVDPAGSASVLVHTEAGDVLIPRIAPPGTPIMVNQTKQSLPPLDPSLPDLSVAGLELAVSDPNDSTKPGVLIEPLGGAYTETIPVIVRAVPAPSGAADPNVRWQINGGGFGAPKVLEARFFLVRNGTYQIDAFATQNSVSSGVRSVTYELTASKGLQRDTDGDGIPDLVEVALGLDPLTKDHTRDSDGDGWSDLDEILRGVSPNDPNATPTDSDGDGWSDVDEEWRETNPHDIQLYRPDRPVARRLYEVEHILSGQIFEDEGPSPPTKANMGRLSVHDVFWNQLYDQASLPTEAELDSEGLTQEQKDTIPVYLQRSQVHTALSGGNLPPLRLPAGESSIVRTRHLDPNEPDEWVAKGWLESVPDISPADVTAFLATSDPNWDDPNDWLDAYRNYLDDNLADPNNPKVLNLSPRSALGIALLEGLIAWYDKLAGDGLILLGNATSLQPFSAVEDIKDAMAQIDPNRNLDVLHAEYAGLAAPGDVLDAFGTTVVGYYADPNGFAFLDPNGARDLTTTIAAASLVQGDPNDDDRQARYVLRLLSIVPASELPELPPGAFARRALAVPPDLLDPDADSDGDGIPNGLELSAAPDLATDPRSADSDTGTGSSTRSTSA